MSKNAPATRTGRGGLEEDTVLGGHFDEHFASQMLRGIKLEFKGIRIRENEHCVLRDYRTARLITKLTVVEFPDGTLGYLGEGEIVQIMSEEEMGCYLDRKAEEEMQNHEDMAEQLRASNED